MNKNTKRLEIIRKYLDASPPLTLDLGSAGMDKGFDLHKELKKYYPNTVIVGVDVNQNENVDIIADLNKDFSELMPKADLIIACEVIEHIENPHHFMRECNKCLVPGGKLILTTPNSAGLPYILPINVKPKEDITLMNLDVLNANIAEFGFKIIEAGYLNNYYRRNLLLRLIGFTFKRIRPTIYLVAEKI